MPSAAVVPEDGATREALWLCLRAADREAPERAELDRPVRPRITDARLLLRRMEPSRAEVDLPALKTGLVALEAETLFEERESTAACPVAGASCGLGALANAAVLEGGCSGAAGAMGAAQAGLVALEPAALVTVCAMALRATAERPVREAETPGLRLRMPLTKGLLPCSCLSAYEGALDICSGVPTVRADPGAQRA